MGKSAKQATKQAIYEGKVAQLDNLGTGKDAVVFEDEQTTIEKICGDFILRVKENIDSAKDLVVTGAISDIRLQAIDGGVEVLGNKQLIYQDRGVNGSVNKLYDTPHSYNKLRPPINVFKEWIREKNIITKNNEKYSKEKPHFDELHQAEDPEKEIEKAAWAISTKIFQDGFKPRNLYSKEIPQLVSELEAQIAGFAIQQIVQNIDVKDSAKRVIVPN